jgi:hypothetical protein
MRTSLYIALMLSWACSGDDPGDPGTPTAPVAPEDVTVAQVTAPTVLKVSWTTAEPAEGQVRFTVDGVERMSARRPAADAHEQLLVGLPPNADVRIEVLAGPEGAEVAAEPVDARTGDLVAPTFTVEGESDRYLVLPLIDEDVSTIAVIDPKGRVVWSHDDRRGLAVFRARVARDGSGLIYTATLIGGEPNEGSVVVRVPWDGGPEEVTPVPYLAHDFVELDDGSLVSLAYEFRDGIEGNKLVRIARDGALETLWSAWDCYDPAVHLSIDLEHGWIHANALDRHPDGGFIVGMRNLTSLVRVDDSGTCLWGLGGAAGTVAVDGPSFFHQHQFELLDGGMLVFDNDGAPGNESRVIEYTFDEAAQTASIARVFQADPPMYSFILGDVHRIDDDTMITWSVPSTVDRYDADGARVYRVSADDADLIFGFTELMVDPGRPDLGASR